MLNSANRLILGAVGAALCSGIALTNAAPFGVTLGWALIGFAIGAAIDLVVYFLLKLG